MEWLFPQWPKRTTDSPLTSKQPYIVTLIGCYICFFNRFFIKKLEIYIKGKEQEAS